MQKTCKTAKFDASAPIMEQIDFTYRNYVGERWQDCLQNADICAPWGNAKVKVLTINLPCGISCVHGRKDPANLHCFADCYARRHMALAKKYKMRAWALWTTDPDGYFARIQAKSDRLKAKIIRWHSDGEIPSLDYLERMVAFHLQNPDIHGYGYTKREDILEQWEAAHPGEEFPANLVINWSAWHDIEIPSVVARLGLGICYVDRCDGLETRIPEKARKCRGNGCGTTCKMCLFNRSGSRPIFFPEH